ncbi:hypothetical protein LCL97_04715 [Seohaeicola saemankumensis]|nr:hypothetical protein [Seohaeicola saemankumensis]MCA0870112.1 hypothetical protein [Seohaeicola saemankumensis]
MSSGCLRIRLRGNFSVCSDDGRDLTPKSKKAIGLLALLAECDTMTRNRRWLEDKLWSDRGPKQAHGSLRTTLNEIRKSFGDHAALLGSDRSSVWLDPAAVTNDLDDPNARREFLEGLDIADDEFNDWLIQKRVKYDVAPDAPAEDPGPQRRVTIQCGEPWTTPGQQGVMSQIVSDQIGKIVSDFVAASRCTVSQTNADLIIRTTVQEDDAGSAVFVQVIDPVKDDVVHSDHCLTDNLSSFLRSQDLLGRFCWNVADMALEKLPDLRETQTPIAVRSGFAQEALRDVLSFDAGQMRNSLSTLDAAADHLDSGLFQALKAWAMTSMIMEDFLEEDAAVLAEIKGLLKRAQELSPREAIVAAITANVQAILLEDYNSALVLARQALRENPNNLFALQAMSAGRAARGDLDMAYDLSRHSTTIAGFSKFEAMCNLHHALLCITMQKREEALESSRIAADTSPNYRAPRRQLIALSALGQNPDQALDHIGDLKKIEPDFSVERFLFDRNYPSNTLRKSGYLSKVQPFLTGTK